MSNETPWTPGPWHWEEDGWEAADEGGSVHCNDGDNPAIEKYMGLALLGNGGQEPIIPLRIDHYEAIYDGAPIAPANRRLIAAAPEMAALLEQFITVGDRGTLEQFIKLSNDTRALLAKIKG